MMTASFLWIRCSTSSEVIFKMLAELGPSVTYTVSLESATIDLDITMVVCCNAASIINEAMYKQHSDMVSHRHAILCSVWRQPHLLCCWRSNFDFGLYINKPFMTRLQWDRWVIYYSQDFTWLVTSWRDTMRTMCRACRVCRDERAGLCLFQHGWRRRSSSARAYKFSLLVLWSTCWRRPWTRDVSRLFPMPKCMG